MSIKAFAVLKVSLHSVTSPTFKLRTLWFLFLLALCKCTVSIEEHCDLYVNMIQLS